MLQPFTRRGPSPSPLRYPGGKAALAGFLEHAINRQGLCKPLFVEPYAGGAGAGLDLLYRGVIGGLVVNDFDPAVHAIWAAMLNDTAAFLRRVETVPLTVDEWRRQRAIYRQRNDDVDQGDLGFAAFYLNRTSRSGILGGGIIGGFHQSGTSRVHSRFTRARLRQRVERVAEHATRIRATCEDGAAVLREHLPDATVFAYVDPPYHGKGGSLYPCVFDTNAHANLAATLNRFADANWALSYDRADPVRAAYRDRVAVNVNVRYSAHRCQTATEIVILSDPVAAALPQSTAAPVLEACAQ